VAPFVLGGAAKAGTTALADLLSQHPQLHLCPRKEAHHHLFRDQPPMFTGPGDATFARMVVSDPAEWRALRAAAPPGTAFGDVSVYYLYRPEVWPRLAAALGDEGRVVLILRDPLERISSAWGHLVRDGRESLDLAGALAAEDDRVAAGWEWCWHLRRVSRYHEQLPAVLAAFGPERVLVVDHRRLRHDPAGLVEQIHRFLGVEPLRPEPRRASVNPSGRARSRHLHRFLTEPHPLKDIVRPVVPDRLVQGTYHRAMVRNLTSLPTIDEELARWLAMDLAPVAAGVHQLVGLDTSQWCRLPPASEAGGSLSGARSTR
jgi:hypothetical protein